MSSILLALVPENATPSDWDNLLKAMAAHRAAHDGKSVTQSALSGQALADRPAPPVAAAPTPDPVQAMFAAAPPTAPSLTIEDLDATGDPEWLARYYNENGQTLPTADADNWPHIVSALKGKKGLPDALQSLYKSANMHRTRRAKELKGGNGGGQSAEQAAPPADLGSFLGTSAPAAGPTLPPAPDVSNTVQVASELNERQRAAVWAWTLNLTGEDNPSGNKALFQAWHHGTINPQTGKPLTLDDLVEYGKGKQVTGVRKAIRKAAA